MEWGIINKENFKNKTTYDVPIKRWDPLSTVTIRSEDFGLRKERIRYKSGLIPALYADVPNTSEEIWESERKYIRKYERHPRRTDFIYFFKIINNILFQGARSE